MTEARYATFATDDDALRLPLDIREEMLRVPNHCLTERIHAGATTFVIVVVLALTFLVTGCNRKQPAASQNAAQPTSTESAKTDPPASGSETPEQPENLVPIEDLGASQLKQLNKPSTGDMDEIERRRFIRALVLYDRTSYFIDGKDQKGLSYDALVQFEKWLRTESSDKNRALKVAIIPTPRARLLSDLKAGLGDIALGNLTITHEREKIVDFTDPVMDNVQELVVTGPTAPPISSVDDLSGQEVYVRASSSYRTNLDSLNHRFASEGKHPVTIRFTDELLEDDDIMQMVDGGVYGITVVDRHIAQFWTQIYDRAIVHPDVVLNSGGEIAIAVRKNCPQLKALLNEFIKGHKIGTTFGNIVLQRYLGKADRLKNPKSEEELKRFRALVASFRKYSGEVGLPWLLVTAQAYQESQLDQEKRSSAGAVGIMQIKPETAADVGIHDIDQTDNNIRAGVKYLRYILDRYFKDAHMDRINQGLFAFAAYNAGPARVAGLRAKAETLGLNPNVWFNNVEIVAAREIGRETVDYVSNIFKYYTTYLAIVEQTSHTKKSSS
ncbi:MAG TPA: lytic transglycosylase F [Blastocatellia bacterium]|nr:lytic transglycosylase F [Blastocatellia bacterium]